MNLLNRLTIILLALLAVSCSSSGIKVNSLNHGSEEGVVVGKIKILLNGTNVTTNSVLSFNGITWGTDMLQIQNEDYFLIKLPEGKNNLKAVISKLSESHRGIRYFFPEGKAAFYVDHSKINYIGDITVRWTGPDEGPAVGFTGPFSAFRATTTSTGKADISTVNNLKNVVNFIENKFPANTNDIGVSLLGGHMAQVEQVQHVDKVEQPEQMPQLDGEEQVGQVGQFAQIGQVEEVDKKGEMEKQEQVETSQYDTDKNIEKRLIYLKKLFEKKIITKKEYEEKRKEIIDEI